MTLKNLGAEQALIGVVLFENEALATLPVAISPDSFAEPAHGRIWSAMAGMINAGRLAEPLSLTDELRADEGFAQLGGTSYLADLIDNAPIASAAPEMARIVADFAMRRSLVTLAAAMASDATAGKLTGAELLMECEGFLADLSRDTAPAGSAVGLDALDMLEGAYRGDFAGAPTGVAPLDRVTGGLRPADVWIIGGRSSMGKSVMGVCLARAIAEAGRGVFFASLEMPRREVQARLIADIAHTPEAPYEQHGSVRYGDILKGRGNDVQRRQAMHAARQLASLPIVIQDVGGLTIHDIRAQGLRQMRGWQKAGVVPGALIIDHLGLVRAHTSRGDSKAAETADIANELKALAKTVGAPVIALAQVNRNSENRNDKRPTMADLNWSGSIEQIADFVGLLYREAYYLDRSADPADIDRARAVEHDIDIIVAKNRSGPICTVKAWVDVARNAVRDHPDDRRAA